MTSTHVRELVMECESDPSGDFILHLKQVCDVTVETFGPEMAASLSVYQLHAHPYPVLGTPHATFHDVAHAQFAPYLSRVDCLAPVAEGGAAADHEATRPLRQIGRQVVGEPIREIFLLGIVAEIGEWQHENGQSRGHCPILLGDCWSGFRRFYRTIGDLRSWGPLRFPHCTDETEALAWQSFDEALFVPGIADCAAGDIQAGRQRPVGDDTAVPNGVDEVVFTDDALPIADQVVEQCEYLWRDGDDVRAAIQLPAVRVRFRPLQATA